MRASLRHLDDIFSIPDDLVMSISFITLIISNLLILILGISNSLSLPKYFHSLLKSLARFGPMFEKKSLI